MRNITVPQERGKVWPESLAMLRESPVYGLGYESYRWHHGVMSSIPDSLFSRQRRTTLNWDTAHNFYIQLTVSNGIVGLIIWLGLAGYVALVLLLDGIANRNLQSFVLVGSLGLFHLYGLTQSMQYIACIWFVMFMFLGYAMLLERRVYSPVLARSGKYGVLAVILAVVAGGVVYAKNPQSIQLAGRYTLPRYAQHCEGEIYKGFYWRENWGKDGYFRWSGRRAEIVLRGSGSVQVDFACYAPRLDSSPLTLEVCLNGHSVARYTFREAGKVTRTYSFADGICLPAVLQLQVSRTWTPKREHMGNDTRVLGVAVSEPKYFNENVAGDVQ
jgi:O-antigen ligase